MKQHRKNRRINGTVLLMVLIFSSQVSARIIYVDDNASGLNNGSSWTNAYNYLQDALSEAEYSDKPIEIRVAHGVYTPDQGENVYPGDIYEYLELINGVTLSGGYAGYLPYDIDIDPDTRDIELYQSILSGDLLNNDTNNCDLTNILDDPNFSDNTLNVVWSYSNDKTAILDGFTITGGNARGLYDGDYFDYDSACRGGGIYIESSYGGPVISNCTFTINGAFEGGAIYSTDSDPNIQNCKFIKNISYQPFASESEGGNGGAVNNTKSNSIFTNCDFADNIANSGAGIYICDDSNMVVTNCLFLNNKATLTNKGEGGGLYTYESNTIIEDCNFYNNEAFRNGGAIVNNKTTNSVIGNCKFHANSAKSEGGAIANKQYSEPNISNCLFTENFSRKGGAITNVHSAPKLSSCTFRNNNSYESAAIRDYNSVSIYSSCIFNNNNARYGSVGQNILGNQLFENCIITGNYGYNSAGVLINDGGNLKIINCTLTGNYSEKVYSVILNNTLDVTPEEYPDQHIYSTGSMEILNSIIWNGPAAISNLNDSVITISYSDIYGGISEINDPNNKLIWGPGNIDEDPLFVYDGFWVDINEPNIIVEPNDPNAFWLEGDYHIQSTAGHYAPNSQSWFLDDVNSPCLDSGDPNSFFENEPLPNGGRINMGAYGNTIEASLSQESPIANKEPDDTEDL